MDPTIKRLFRSEDDSVIAGVCGGIGKYVRVDPVVVRLVWIVLTLLTGIVPGALVYGLAWVIVPRRPRPTAPQSSGPHSNATIEVDPVG